MKLTISVLFFAVLFAIAVPSLADNDKHSGDRVIVNNNYNQEIINNVIQESVKGSALASALAGIDCNMSTDKLHGGIFSGWYGDTFANSIGVCKRFEEGMFKFSMGIEGSEMGGNIGFMFYFE